MSKINLISSDELRERLRGDREHAVVDVRREGDYSQGHLFYASNIPRSLLELRIEQLIPRSDVPITIVATGRHADDIGDALAHFGYTDVRFLEGELDGWTASGGALFSGVNVPSKAFGEFIETEAHTPHIGPKELERSFHDNPDVMLFDCRPAGEYEAMSIPGAINCPGAELVYRFFANVPSAATKVYVNCAGRTRSIIGAQSLIDAGVPNMVAAVNDGAMGWQLAGFEVERGANRQAAAADRATLSQVRMRASDRARSTGVRFVTAEECQNLLHERSNRTTYLFDVRDPAEYNLGHLPHAVSAPGGQLVQTFDAYAPVHNARVILADSDGIRAPGVALWLRQMGVKEVLVTHDGAGTCLDLPPTPRGDCLMAESPQISATDANAALLSGTAAALDLSTSKEYRNAHIPNSRYVERHEIESALDACPHPTIILTSVDGRLASVVAAELKKSSRTGIFALAGGTKDWVKAGLPTESGNGNLPDQLSDVFYRPYDKTDGAKTAMQDYLDWERGLLDRISKEPGVHFIRLAGNDAETR